MKSIYRHRISVILVSIVCFITLEVRSQQVNWTHFRGSNLDGISAEQQVPVEWNDTTNIMWKTDIDGKGWSSPVVFADQIWVTTATEEGKKMSGICLDFNTGRKIFDINLFQPDSAYPKHSINTYATPTPCIEKGFVYLHFGTYGTACLNTSNGDVVWKRTDLNCDHVQGPGSSPILYKNLLILHIEGIDVQYIIALDKKTGKTVWKTNRPAELYEPWQPIGRKAYITPLVVKVNGKDMLISNGSSVCIAYDPETGKEIWRIVQGEDSTIAMPISENGIVYFYPGFVTPPEGKKYAELLAVNPDGVGDIAKTNILWRFKSPTLQLSTPIIKNGLIYTIDTRNMFYCLDAKTGQALYSKKMKQKYNSSPIYAGGNIYFTSIKGNTTILKAGDKLQIVAENELEGDVYATPAILRNSIVMRTGTSIYRIENSNNN